MTVNEVRANMGLTPLTPAQLAQLKPVAAQKKTLGKDASDDEDEDDEEDNEAGEEENGDGENKGEDSNSGDDSDFNSKHPRWPAGSPGGIGGEFVPKDEGDATQALHDAIASDPSSISADDIRTALTSAIDQPSRLADGTQVAADDGVKSDATNDILNTWGDLGTLASTMRIMGMISMLNRLKTMLIKPIYFFSNPAMSNSLQR